MNGIPEPAILAGVVTGLLVALAIAWLVGSVFRRIRKGGSAGMAFAGLLTLMVGASVLLASGWGAFYVIDKHDFFRQLGWPQLFVVIGVIVWLGGLFGAFANGERGKRATNDDE